MKIESKYLSKNYFLYNGTIHKTMGIKTSWFYVVNDIKDTFSCDSKIAKDIVNNWCVEQGVDVYKNIIESFDYLGILSSKKFESVFPIKNFEYKVINNDVEFIQFGSVRQRVVTRLPEYELMVTISFNDLDESFKDFILEFPMSVMVDKENIDLIIINTKNESQFIAQETLLTKITTNIETVDNDEEDYSLNIVCAMELKPNIFKVEY